MTTLHKRTLDTKRYRWRKANGIQLFTSAEPIKQHIAELGGLGVTPQMIGYVVGCDRQAIQAVATCKRIRIDFAARILTVTVHPHPRQLHVLAIGARRRIEALQALGWPRRVLAARLNVDSSIVSQLCSQRHTSYARWHAVQNLYEQLSGTRGPSNHVASIAHQAGKVPPLAWEGIDIDDPRTQPDWAAAGIKLAERPVCPRGHAYTAVNTKRTADGRRSCRTCRRVNDTTAKRNARRRAANAA
ncbi:hypothetical protein [Nocardia rhizosphaerae]|uniref:Uncharacterized protein n=1 Tax=Nocardia rhizosphaerae TaxID=1691571 RepID=A0ABV8LF48_9NOCA